MALNKVMLIGNVGRDPEVRYLDGQNGSSKVATFTLATTERYKDRNGESKEITEWHNIVVWRGLADLIEKYVKKGTQLYIEGRLRTRSWDDQNGNKRYSTEIMADNVQLLGRKSDNPATNFQGGAQSTHIAQPSYTEATAVHGTSPASASQAASSTTAAPAKQAASSFNLDDDMPDDDLPF